MNLSGNPGNHASVIPIDLLKEDYVSDISQIQCGLQLRNATGETRKASRGIVKRRDGCAAFSGTIFVNK